MITIGNEISRDVVESCDVCVVGSGAGGGSMAAELSEAGLEVVILEEGGYYQSKEFSLDPAKAVPMLYRDAGSSVIMGKPNIIFSEGKCVGGSTVINGGMCWRTPEKVLQRWRWELGLKELTPKHMEPYLAKVEERINAAPQSPESLGRGDMLFRQAADKLGWLIHPNKRNQKGCTGEGICMFGCPTDKKQSVLITYIPRALNKGARLYTDVKVLKVKTKGRVARSVEARFVDRKTGKKKPHQLTVNAKVIVLAGGALQTPVMLMNSGIKCQGNVGRHFHCHPNVKCVGIFDDPVNYWRGVHQGHQIHHFIDEGILMAIGVVHPGLTALSFPQIGRDSIELLELWNHMLVAGGLVDDTTTGHISRAPWGEPLAWYNIDHVEHERLIRLAALLSELLFTAGARRVLLPFSSLDEIRGPDEIKKIYDAKIKPEEIEVLTVHALATTRMGADPRNSVVNPWGECWDVEKLFIADAGVVPTSLGVNPQETIMALSTRTGQYILENKRKYLA
ncbi:MAG TPA: GMC family oxidoreductase [bacterium]|nr:GMC family oxidoreductase [bacterium]